MEAVGPAVSVLDIVRSGRLRPLATTTRFTPVPCRSATIYSNKRGTELAPMRCIQPSMHANGRRAKQKETPDTMRYPIGISLLTRFPFHYPQWVQFRDEEHKNVRSLWGHLRGQAKPPEDEDSIEWLSLAGRAWHRFSIHRMMANMIQDYAHFPTGWDHYRHYHLADKPHPSLNIFGADGSPNSIDYIVWAKRHLKMPLPLFLSLIATIAGIAWVTINDRWSHYCGNPDTFVGPGYSQLNPEFIIISMVRRESRLTFPGPVDRSCPFGHLIFRAGIECDCQSLPLDALAFRFGKSDFMAIVIKRVIKVFEGLDLLGAPVSALAEPAESAAHAKEIRDAETREAVDDWIHESLTKQVRMWYTTCHWEECPVPDLIENYIAEVKANAPASQVASMMIDKTFSKHYRQRQRGFYTEKSVMPSLSETLFADYANPVVMIHLSATPMAPVLPALPAIDHTVGDPSLLKSVGVFIKRVGMWLGSNNTKLLHMRSNKWKATDDTKEEKKKRTAVAKKKKATTKRKKKKADDEEEPDEQPPITPLHPPVDLEEAAAGDAFVGGLFVNGEQMSLMFDGLDDNGADVIRPQPPDVEEPSPAVATPLVPDEGYGEDYQLWANNCTLEINADAHLESKSTDVAIVSKKRKDPPVQVDSKDEDEDAVIQSEIDHFMYSVRPDQRRYCYEDRDGVLKLSVPASRLGDSYVSSRTSYTVDEVGLATVRASLLNYSKSRGVCLFEYSGLSRFSEEIDQSTNPLEWPILQVGSSEIESCKLEDPWKWVQFDAMYMACVQMPIAGGGVRHMPWQYVKYLTDCFTISKRNRIDMKYAALYYALSCVAKSEYDILSTLCVVKGIHSHSDTVAVYELERDLKTGTIRCDHYHAKIIDGVTDVKSTVTKRAHLSYDVVRNAKSSVQSMLDAYDYESDVPFSFKEGIPGFNVVHVDALRKRREQQDGYRDHKWWYATMDADTGAVNASILSLSDPHRKAIEQIYLRICSGVYSAEDEAKLNGYNDNVFVSLEGGVSIRIRPYILDMARDWFGEMWSVVIRMILNATIQPAIACATTSGTVVPWSTIKEDETHLMGLFEKMANDMRKILDTGVSKPGHTERMISEIVSMKKHSLGPSLYYLRLMDHFIDEGHESPDEHKRIRKAIHETLASAPLPGDPIGVHRTPLEAHLAAELDALVCSNEALPCVSIFVMFIANIYRQVLSDIGTPSPSIYDPLHLHKRRSTTQRVYDIVHGKCTNFPFGELKHERVADLIERAHTTFICHLAHTDDRVVIFNHLYPRCPPPPSANSLAMPLLPSLPRL
jgi:hypothetical protein